MDSEVGATVDADVQPMGKWNGRAYENGGFENWRLAEEFLMQ
jgi:hypothetical protein